MTRSDRAAAAKRRPARYPRSSVVLTTLPGTNGGMHVSVLDMNDATVAARVRDLGIRPVPAVVIDGKLADCCTGRGIDEQTLRVAGLGQPLP